MFVKLSENAGSTVTGWIHIEARLVMSTSANKGMPGAVALCALLLLTRDAWSCSCLPYSDDPDEAAKQGWTQADAVVAGKVVKKRTIPGDTGLEPVEISLAVTRQWKGPGVESLKIRTASSSAACGYAFRTGQEYLVFAFRDPAENRYSTGICSLTRPMEQASRFIPVLDALASSERARTRSLEK